MRNSMLFAALAASICYAAADAAKGSIIDPKYKDRYKEPDWLGTFITDRCYDTPEKGPAELNTNKLFKLAEANSLDVSELKGQVGRTNAPGRLRMTVGNMLRAAAKHRLGLFDMDGTTWVKAPKDFLVDKDGNAITEATHNRDGTKIAVAKPAAAPKADKAPAKAATVPAKATKSDKQAKLKKVA